MATTPEPFRVTASLKAYRHEQVFQYLSQKKKWIFFQASFLPLFTTVINVVVVSNSAIHWDVTQRFPQTKSKSLGRGGEGGRPNYEKPVSREGLHNIPETASKET